MPHHIAKTCLLLTFAAIAAHAQTFTKLVNFNGTNGANPRYEALVQGLDGNLYGTTAEGGSSLNLGTVFAVTPQGQLTTLKSFAAYDGGGLPDAGLIVLPDGTLYGTSSAVGARGYGNIFQITPSGTLTTLFNFDSADGAHPFAGLAEGTNGTLYGTTWQGGANDAGAVFQITLDGRFTTLHSFDRTDGAYPYAGLLQAANGLLYGTTFYGGAYENGAIYLINQNGTFNVVHSFALTDGRGPAGGLV